MLKMGRTNTIILLSVLGICLFCFASNAVSQETSAASKGNEVDSSVMNLRMSYEFAIGEQIDYALISGCSIYIGIIETVEGDTLHLTVSEPLSERRIRETAVTLQVRRLANMSYSPWSNTDLSIGHQLLVAKCGDRVRLAVSDETLFDSIRKTINFDQFVTENSSLLRDIPSKLQEHRDCVFVGYVTDMLWRKNFARDMQAVVLSEILAGENMPDRGLGKIRLKLLILLRSEGERAISNQARSTVVSNLVNAVSTGKGSTDQIFTLLCELADADKLELSSELNQNTRHTILGKFKQFKQKTEAACRGAQKLEEMLKAK